MKYMGNTLLEEKNKKVVLDREYLKNLQRKASFFDEFLNFIEEKALGSLMEETENEENISLPEAEKLLK